MGGANAFNGTYCYKDDCACYERDSDAVDTYDVSIELEDNDITFEYRNGMVVYYQAKYSKQYYGDLRCTETFFNSDSNNDGKWTFYSHSFNELNNKDIDIEPSFSSQHCYCV